MISRRHFVSQLIPAAGLSLLATVGVNGQAAIGDKMTTANKNRALFMSLSRFLTGFDTLDADLGESYFHYLKQQVKPATWSGLLTVFEANQQAAPNVLQAQLMEHTSLRKAAQQIIQLWYCGWLTAEQSTGRLTYSSPPTNNIPVKIRAVAYKQSLAWKSMGLTPRGVPSGQLWETSSQRSF